MTVTSKAIPNLIQGVSQQAPQQRRDTQCEEQFDCVNSPVDGCVARPPAEAIKFLSGEDFTGAYCYDIFRADTEHYLVVIKGGNLRVFDVGDGTECTVTFPDGKAYLTVTADDPKNVFRAATVDDFTFIVNRQVVPANSPTTSDAEIEEGIFYFKAGAYSTTFTLRLTFLGTVYSYSYTSPDNSVSGNAAFIATNELNFSLYSALDSTFTALGFSKERRGNVARIWRTDNQHFDLDSDDGEGDTMLHVAKGFIQDFNLLPQSAFDGFKLKVQGEKRNGTDDYYTTFQGEGTSDAVWQEDIGWSVPNGVDPTTMPFQLVNTDFREFIFEQSPWGARLAGDEITAKDPSFIGVPIQDIFWDNPRLALVTEGSTVWSKSRNPYVYFPDTVQTVLAEAPIDVDVSAARTVALLRKGVIAQDSLTLWAQKAQFKVDASGQQPFTQDSVEVKETAAYEFVEVCDPCPVASSLYFATATGDFITIRDILFDAGKLVGDTDVTQHVPQYIPVGIRQIVASDTVNLMSVATEGDPAALYIYNWFLTNQDRIQSAWNKWRLPSDCTVLWIGIHTNILKVLVQRTDGVMLLSINLAPRYKDAEGSYLTRMDLRITDASCTMTYSATLDETSITIPFGMPECLADLTKMMVVVRQSNVDLDTGITRGTQLTNVSMTGKVLKVKGDQRTTAFYLGQRISAEREESEFYIRGASGSQPTQRLQVLDYRTVHSKTGYYRAEVTQSNGKVRVYEMEARVLGDPTDLLDQIVLNNGILKTPLKNKNTAVSVRLINDSFMPSQWQTAEYDYIADIRSSPAPQQGASGQTSS